jgi:hypothetical protein
MLSSRTPARRHVDPRPVPPRPRAAERRATADRRLPRGPAHPRRRRRRAGHPCPRRRVLGLGHPLGRRRVGQHLAPCCSRAAGPRAVRLGRAGGARRPAGRRRRAVPATASARPVSITETVRTPPSGLERVERRPRRPDRRQPSSFITPASPRAVALTFVTLLASMRPGGRGGWSRSRPPSSPTCCSASGSVRSRRLRRSTCSSFPAGRGQGPAGQPQPVRHRVPRHLRRHRAGRGPRRLRPGASREGNSRLASRTRR